MVAAHIFERNIKTEVLYYRPQRSCGKLMFLHLSIILSGGGCLPPCMLGYTPSWVDTPLLAETPWAPLGRPLPTPPWANTPLGRHPPPPADGYCSGWYASYWNAFLFVNRV